MAKIVVQCGQADCQNTFSHDDAVSAQDVEAMAQANGWVKQQDGTWRGCAAPGPNCPMVVPPEPAE